MAHKRHGGAHSTYINGLATVAALIDAKGGQQVARQILDEAEQLQEELEVNAVTDAIQEDISIGDSDDSQSCSGESDVRGGLFTEKSQYFGRLDGGEESECDEEFQREFANLVGRPDKESRSENDESDNSLWSLGSIDEAECINELTKEVEDLEAQGKYEEAAKLLSEAEARLLEEVDVTPIGMAALHTLWGSLLELLGETEMSEDLFAQASEILEDQALDPDENESDDGAYASTDENEGDESLVDENEYNEGNEAFIHGDSPTSTEETAAEDDTSSTAATPDELVAREKSNSLTTASTLDAEDDLAGAENMTPQAPSAPSPERRPSMARRFVQADPSGSPSKTVSRAPRPVVVPSHTLRTGAPSTQGRGARSSIWHAAASQSTTDVVTIGASASGAPQAITTTTPTTSTAPSTSHDAPPSSHMPVATAPPRRIGGGFGGGNFVPAANLKPKKAGAHATSPPVLYAGTTENPVDVSGAESREETAMWDECDAKDAVTYGRIAPAIRICDHYIGSNRVDEAVTVLQALLDVMGESPIKNTDLHVSVFEKYCKVQRMVGGFDFALDALMAADEILEDRAPAGRMEPTNGAADRTASADKDVARRASLHGAMGEVCLDGQDFKRAQQFLEKSLDFFSTTSSSSHALVDIERRKTLTSLAQCFVKQGKFELAEEAFTQAYSGHDSLMSDEETSEQDAAVDVDDVDGREAEKVKA
eukprot:GEMP01019625.1.p1 GENE.GEMP01019625.1~~GEMP01019625.1.p1  ORF type:complete len:803 (+),score=258.25 GEMP01019625.1:281-2410(+)